MTTSELEKINKDLENIIKLQVQHEATLEEGLEAEKRVSGALMKKWLDREQTLSDWEYSYWLLQQKFTKAIKDIRFLNYYIETNELRKKEVKGKKKANKDK